MEYDGIKTGLRMLAENGFETETSHALTSNTPGCGGAVPGRYAFLKVAGFRSTRPGWF